MKLSIVIVNYNVKYYLEQCLCSVFRAIDNISAEVMVVDNASTDQSMPYIVERFPSVKYIYNNENVGFARANNQAIRQAQGEYVLLLNPDTIIPEDTLEKVLRFMDYHPNAGAAGVKMVRDDGQFLKESKRGYPTLTATFGKLTGLGNMLPRFKSLGSYYCNGLDEDHIHQVEVLAGAFMMLRATALSKAGMLDEDFFMYGEDVDLSCRIENAGFKNYYLPYTILHYKGESTSKESYHYVRVFCEAMIIFFQKHGQRYNFVSRHLVNASIYLQMYIRMSVLFLKRTLGFYKNSTHSMSNKYNTQRYIVFADESSIYSLRQMLQRNGLEGKHHFVVSNEVSSGEGHGNTFAAIKEFTHVVYDCKAYSFSKIISLLSCYRNSGLHLGVYNPESRVLVTLKNCYT